MILSNLSNEGVVAFIDLLGVGLGGSVFLAKPKKRTQQFFLLWIIGALLIVNLGYLSEVEKFFSYSLSLRRWTFGSVSIFMIFVYYFVLYFPKKGESSRVRSGLYTLIWLIMLYISVFTPYFLKDTKREFWGVDVVYGKWYPLFYIWVIFSIFFVLYILFKKYGDLSEQNKRKTQYFLVGALLYGTFNLVFNVLFPLFTGSMRYYKIGDYSMVFPLIFTTYSIVQEEMFGIRVFLTELLIGTMALILGLLPFVIRATLSTKILLGAVFLCFCFVGYLLSKYARERTRTQKFLEKKVKEKTKELQEAKQVLQIQVKAKTKELQEINESLERKVQERTKELQGKVEQLERFSRLTVGRETKMIELKKEVERLKKEND